MDDIFDTIIIGAGQAGVPLARAVAEAGKSVALIERAEVGGTCINYGCTPTKTMIASASTSNAARRASEFGVIIDSFHVDMNIIRERKRAMVESWRSSSESSLNGVDKISLIYGDARFTGPKTVAIALRSGPEMVVSAQTIVINTGGRPTVPNLPGLSDVPYLDSTSIMELDTLPEHLIVLGGGYISCEFAQMFRRFGSRVTVIQRGSQLLGQEDKDIADAVLDIFREEGIEFQLNVDAKSVVASSTGIVVTCLTDGKETFIEGSHLLVAVGRSPNTNSLNLAAANIDVDARGFIKVNDQLETNQPGVFAAGDVKGGPAFTHISYDDYRVLKRHLMDGDQDASIAGRLEPYTVFIDPQLGRVGLSEAGAKAKGRPVQVAKMPMSRVARAVESGESKGFMKAIVDQETKQILGCAVLGMQGGEIMALMQVAIMSSMPYTRLRDGIFAHPTLAEALNNLFFEFN